jgi:hypothetical protein
VLIGRSWPISHDACMTKKSHHIRPLRSGTLRVVDVENLCGGSEHVSHRSDAVLGLLAKMAPKSRRLMTTIAAGVSVLDRDPHLWWAWSGFRVLVGRGVDGADNRLMETLLSEPLARGVSEVEIWSGDHCFVTAVDFLRGAGVTVRVVAPRTSLSLRLARVANSVVVLDPAIFSLNEASVARAVAA